MYYSAIIFITWMTLAVLCILVHENDRFHKDEKKRYYSVYLVIATAALGEWLGYSLNGMAGISPILLIAAKFVDYIFTPLAGGIIINQLGARNRWSTIITVVLLANIVFQICSLFTGWMMVIDDQNYYHHGSLYFIYVLVCLIVLVMVAIQFLIYGRSFSRQNRLSLYAIMMLIFFGVIMQETAGSEIRTAHLSLAVGVTLLFIHNAEFAQLEQDENIARQNVQIMTDALTGVRSRFAYSKALKTLAAQEALPEGFVSFSIDVNGLKTVNDTLGHDAGDELICGTATCIQKTFGEKGECYRTGGDEFVVLAVMEPAQADAAIERLLKEVEQWKGESVQHMHVAAGYALASEHPDLSPEKLVAQSDKTMYAAKAAYYREVGIDRRGAVLQDQNEDDLRS